MEKINKEIIAERFQKIQQHICEALEKEDGIGKFKTDLWERPQGGGGATKVLANGKIIAKGGVAFSAVHGPTPEKILKKLSLEEADFFATGVSIVIHPINPMVPIIHMNIRYFEMSNGTYWFGGGIDLTPHFVDVEDASYFHKQLKAHCDAYDDSYYEKFKQWADDYFFIPHRKETRGIGGIFFDRLSANEKMPFPKLLSFVEGLGYLFPKIYCHFMANNHKLPYGDQELKWQALRRGRYVEFNLVWDAGTKFGLDTNGRTESILMSMPPEANWVYNQTPEAGSEALKTLELLKKGINWIKD
ncbi:oxygen-dependent coproporphyrinogen oxidase [Cyclobacterium marinum]|uniref:oxygen-dependent coproporphyrinogen oxidase n=1 Tax=Cyclobacterium marinum TaxID=104 RepID=UPI0011EBB4E0|nr:oxygen-dependent coproporphyrinogen oxidase [Cyclobacterium marinum]MBI0399062.1 oxygen-dependent coproporphyrinogen oxidase [Cyclobacterium marinum]